MDLARKLAFLTAVVVAFTTPSFAEDQVIADGKNVKMHYTLTVEGQVADSSEGKEPLLYTQGKGMIIPGLEKQLVGLKAGDKKTVAVVAAEGYGPVNPQLRMEFPKEQIKGDMDPQVGMVLQVQSPEGQTALGVIEEIKETAVLLNFNHPLAGKDLNFDVTIVEVN